MLSAPTAESDGIALMPLIVFVRCRIDLEVEECIRRREYREADMARGQAASYITLRAGVFPQPMVCLLAS